MPEPFLALITPLSQSGPVDPGFGVKPPGVVTPPIYYPPGPVDPGYSPPWARPPVDPGYNPPGVGAPGGKPPIHSQLPSGHPSGYGWQWAYAPASGWSWVWVPVPDPSGPVDPGFGVTPPVDPGYHPPGVVEPPNVIGGGPIIPPATTKPVPPAEPKK